LENIHLITAAGGLFLALDTGRVCLQQRSQHTSHPKTWAFWGGKAEPKERPIETLLREFEEEIGSLPDVQKIHPLHIFKSKNNQFEYHTFIVAVYEEFIPILNNESDGYCWVKIGNWPRPLHPGSKNILYEKRISKKIGTIYNRHKDNTNGPNWIASLYS
tara:strand:- start:1360 stop:1839 length:480 start_codon:yes stop_codon:yes gene_type:complete